LRSPPRSPFRCTRATSKGASGIGITALLTLAVIVRNSWVDATGDVARATRADRRGLAVLTACYFLAAALISVFSLT